MKRTLARHLPLLLVPLVGCRCERAEDAIETPVPVASSAAPVARESIPLLEAMAAARRSGQADFRAPSGDEAKAYEAWVRVVAKAAWTDRLPAEAPPDGFSGRLGADGRIWLLQELPTRKRGAGLVAVRPSRGAPVLIEAPHTFFDEDTLEIALLVFHGIEARALVINTMHRYGGSSPEERQNPAAIKDSPSDVAHAPNTFFTAAHRALVGAEPTVTLQIHGFADATAPGVMAVVSAAKTSADAHAVARALRDALGDERVRAYPDEIDVLGGTTNVQAKASREQNVPFVHLELSRTLRRSLLADPALAERFVSALRVVGEAPP